SVAPHSRRAPPRETARGPVPAAAPARRSGRWVARRWRCDYQLASCRRVPFLVARGPARCLRLPVGVAAGSGATSGHEGGLLDLVDRPLLVAVLDPAGVAAGADGDRVQTEGDGDQGRSAQRTAGDENLTDGERALV